MYFSKIIKAMQYPLEHKRQRYPYHQYLQRFDDGCLGFHQIIYYEIVQSWVNMEVNELRSSLSKIKKQIVSGLNQSFQAPDIFYKYEWLKDRYNELIILTDDAKEIISGGGDYSRYNIYYS